MKPQLRCLIVSLLIVLLVGCGGNATALAQTDTSNVLDDLQKDSTFALSDYPQIDGDYSLDVIQLAESTDCELLLYVYQPSGTLKATSVNISQAIGDNIDPHNYKLTLLSKAGTLSKYLVEDIKLSTERTHYYSITSIFRKWNAEIDESSGTDNTIGEVSYDVGQEWTVTSVNGNVTYHYTDIETIEILNPYTNYILYIDGLRYFHLSSCDAHYVAFSTDLPIDDLLEASVSFESRTVETKFYVTTYGGWQPQEVSFSKDDVVVSDNGETYLYAAEEYEFSRIVKTEEFMATEDLDDAEKEAIANTEWVLRFYETPYVVRSLVPLDQDFTEIANVTILRLKFETDGKVYDMGAVMNKITNPRPTLSGINIPNWVWIAVAVIIVCIVCAISKPAAAVIVWVFKNIIFAPFKLVISLFRRDKK